MDIIESLMETDVRWLEAVKELDEREAEILRQKQQLQTLLQETQIRSRQEGKREGKREGKQEGKHELLLHQLTRKFGPLPDTFVAQMKAITDEAILERIGEQVLTAVSLSDITFSPTD